MTAPNQFALLGQRRFAPFFWTQFLGAANDNLFKFAFTVLVTYQLQLDWLTPPMAGLVIGALFILPFLLFSATSGQITDKFDKTLVIRFVKGLEIGIMALAAAGFWWTNVPLLLACVVAMGLHSTLFGPVKYAYLPQHLDERELTGGNGMVEMGTFVAILLGQLAGGLLIAVPELGRQAVAIAGLALAIGGRLAAQPIPPSPPSDPGLRINWNPFTETLANLRLAGRQPVVFRSLIGISWMWFFGAVFLAQFPAFAKDVLHGDEHVASLLLVVFSIGIGIGSLLCEVVSKRQVEIGLVPLGAIGMTVFAVDLYFAARDLPPSALLGVGEFLDRPAHWRVVADLGLLALSAGVYSVPMYALIQLRSPASHRARVIAANNILNALFMIVSAVLAGAMLAAGATVPEVFLATGLANALVATCLFRLVPEYLLRGVALLLTRLVYRFRVRGEAHIPTDGAAVLVSHHVTFADAVRLTAASPRPITFLMDHRIFATPVVGGFFRLAGAIPIASRTADRALHDRAFERARQRLDEGALICIFPAGRPTADRRPSEFEGDVMTLLAGRPVPVVPIALRGLRDSFFSRAEGRGMRRSCRRGAFGGVELLVGEPMSATAVTPAEMHGRVAALLAS